jgi:hypothetical protein
MLLDIAVTLLRCYMAPLQEFIVAQVASSYTDAPAPAGDGR